MQRALIARRSAIPLRGGLCLAHQELELSLGRQCRLVGRQHAARDLVHHTRDDPLGKRATRLGKEAVTRMAERADVVEALDDLDQALPSVALEDARRVAQKCLAFGDLA